MDKTALAVGVLLSSCLPACNPETVPTSVAQLTCSVDVEGGSTWAHFRASLTGPDVRYQTTVDFGDGAVERRTMQGGDRAARCSPTASIRTAVSSGGATWSPTRPASWRPGTGGEGAGTRAGYRVMTHEFTATTSPSFVSLFVYHIYDFGGPKRGPIDRLLYREDRIKLAPPTATSAVGSAAAILQNGVYHVAPLTGGQFSNQGWETVNVTLRASDFTPVPDSPARRRRCCSAASAATRTGSPSSSSTASTTGAWRPAAPSILDDDDGLPVGVTGVISSGLVPDRRYRR